jgi:hypothetical protein
MTNRIFLILLSLVSVPVVSARDIQSFVNDQLRTYPELRLIDIYKSCFQDYMGAEHMVTDRKAVEEYLEEEIGTSNVADMQPWYYEPCGIKGRYVRVSIRAIKENLISKEVLLDAFMRSANAVKLPSVKSWKRNWKKIVRTIDKMEIGLPNYEEDKQFIDSILSEGKYAISHSQEYKDAYHPHYRIIERTIFENELKPMIERSKQRIQ